MNTPMPQEAFHNWLREALQTALASLRGPRIDPLHTPITAQALSDQTGMRRRMQMHEMFR